ncbi:MAG TPA: toll/interleukin-1 receptor domain-containing protein, partial [Pyrinomonadaceae bacterium]
MTEPIKTPKAFISYSWDNDDHRNWVRELASRLRHEGIDVMLDQWHLAPGDPLPEFMERAVRENDFVILVCTPNFKAKADERKGGVGYEGNIMTGELFIKYNHRKFIPVLRHDNWEEAAPSWLQAKRYLDLTDPRFGENFEKLVQA